MTQLIFEPHRYPRSMSRLDWYKTYRWVRQTRKELQSNEQKMLAAALLCTNERIKADLMEHIINPPIVWVPDDFKIEIMGRPGAICYIQGKWP